jgi:DNA invertase Pin-like site-specific DNA recombinase
MSRQSRQRPPPKHGWAVYLRTSSEEAQNPENSQRRQRHTIQTALFSRSTLPVFNEYIDNLSGRYANNRPGFQLMLEHARGGHFSRVAVENAERFGRNDTEALTAIDALHELGIAVRFADYPDLDPIDPDDRILVSLSFTLARRESIKLGQRVTGGLHAKLRMATSTARRRRSKSTRLTRVATSAGSSRILSGLPSGVQPGNCC